ncbi:hypothetical protein NEAUS03_0943 [Nematocida ausubeli]|nr:hypothetical protein NEAUS03_0943 [Nematocida ausubeli]
MENQNLIEKITHGAEEAFKFVGDRAADAVQVVNENKGPVIEKCGDLLKTAQGAIVTGANVINTSVVQPSFVAAQLAAKDLAQNGPIYVEQGASYVKYNIIPIFIGATFATAIIAIIMIIRSLRRQE